MDTIKALLDQLASITAQIQAEMESQMSMDPNAAPSDQPVQAASEESLRSLISQADAIKAKIEFLEKVQAKELELRSVLERAAPAKVVEKAATPETKEPTVETRTYAVPRAIGKLKAFVGPNAEERAYRAGMHLKGFVLGDEEARRWCRDHGVESRAQAGGINSLGGVLVSEELSSEIIRLVEEYGVVPSEFRRVSMNTDSILVARRTGGLSARPIGENAAPTTSDVTFDNVNLVAKLWGIDNRVPNSQLEDSVINLADTMAVEVAQSFAEAFDNSGLIGDGSSAYHGTVGVATAINDGTHTAGVVTATSHTTFDALTLTDFTNLVARLPLFARRSAKFYISPAGYGSSMLRLMVANAGNNASDIAGGANLQFLGFPVVLCHPLQSALTGTTGTVACLFGDMSQAATYGERRAVTIKTDASRFIEYDQTLTFATARVAIVAHDLGSTSKAGPVVALKFG